MIIKIFWDPNLTSYRNGIKICPQLVDIRFTVDWKKNRIYIKSLSIAAADGVICLELQEYGKTITNALVSCCFL